MKQFLFLFLAMSILSCKNESGMNTENKQATPRLESNDDSFYNIIAKDAVIETIAEGFSWSEGPVWVESEQMLLWTDVPENIVWSWKEGGQKEEYLKPSGYTGDGDREGANGLIINKDGQLVLCQHGDRKLVVMNASLNAPQPAFNFIASRYDGKKFNSPNDVIQDSDGLYFFTDPPYGLPKQDADPDKEMDFQGVFRTIPSEETRKEVILLTDQLTRPNGLALSPDESILYVANSDPKNAIWMKYELTADKTLKDEGKVFFDATDWVKSKKGLPDGMKIRKDGIIFATGPGGVLVFTPEGKHLGTINTGHATANCALNEDGTMLYMTANNYLMRVPLLN